MEIHLKKDLNLVLTSRPFHVAERAGLQCSYPNCDRRTLGTGAKNDETSNSGTAAHIYSAAVGGPRGQGILSEEELKHSDNAIWLCRDHSTLIDNNRGDRFPPQLLLSYKQMHQRWGQVQD